MIREPVRNLAYQAWIDLQDRAVVWQIGAVLLAFAIAWLVNRAAHLERIEASGVWKFGVGGLKRILAPLVALALLVLSRWMLQHYARTSVDVLNLVVPLLGSLALVRVFFYLLRSVFAPGGLLATFERVLAGIVWAGFALHIVGVLPDVLDFLEGTGFAIGKQKVSLWLMLQGLFWTMVTLLASLWLGGAVEGRLMRAETLNSSLRVVLARLAKSLLVLVAVLVVLPLVGIDLTLLSVFGGALGVGLGFGLQKILSNYLSGFIILLDRSIRIGDMITADNFYGRVRRITTRYAVVEGLDGREAIIPNDTLITTTILNHTHSDRKVRHAINVSVAYGTDLELAMRLLRETARGHARVLKDPEPDAYLARFGERAIELELGYWIDDPEKGSLNVRSDIQVGLWRAFQGAAIEIPHPTQVLHAQPAETRARP